MRGLTGIPDEAVGTEQKNRASCERLESAGGNGGKRAFSSMSPWPAFLKQFPSLSGSFLEV
jgi:hypothetical protein